MIWFNLYVFGGVLFTMWAWKALRTTDVEQEWHRWLLGVCTVAFWLPFVIYILFFRPLPPKEKKHD